MFKNADNLAKLALPPVRPEVIPFAPVVVPAGYQAAHTIAVQISVTQWRGRITGAHANSLGGKGHRLDVTRMFGYVDPSSQTTDFMRDQVQVQQDADYAWLKTRLGHKDEDRTLRPDDRHSLVMYRSQAGLVNADLKAWLHMYKQVETAVNYAREQVIASRGEEHYGLLMLVSVSEWQHKQPTNFAPFYEAVIRGISDLEVVRLAPEPGIGDIIQGLPDGFGDETLVDEELSDFVEK